MRRFLATSSGHLAEETVVVTAVASELDALHAVIDRFWARVDQAAPHPPDLGCRLTLTTAIAEICTNIILHAYPNAQEAVGYLQLRLRLYADRIEARLIDQGVPYKLSSTSTIRAMICWRFRKAALGW